MTSTENCLTHHNSGDFLDHPQGPIVNIAAYKFVALDRLPERRQTYLSTCRELGLKGSILLAPEGINTFLAGTRESIDRWLAFLNSQPEFRGIEIKESYSEYQPFSRMLVRLKKEIISMGVDQIRPSEKTSPKLKATELKRWLDNARDITLLDVRNDYEFQVGSFDGALQVGVESFRDFPQAIQSLPAEMRKKPVVMFCTGGIRCEKAGPMMEQAGFEQVYQLDGGILKYFEDCGGEHYRGDCFVFDKRVALDPQLRQTDLTLCFACQAILNPQDQQSEWYIPGKYCPCCNPNSKPMQQRLDQRAERLKAATDPLPGCVPYTNARPMNVPAAFDQRPLIEYLVTVHAKLDQAFWSKACQLGRVKHQTRPLAADEIVRAGWRIYHLVPDTVEPSVSNDVRFLYEDDDLIAIHKPAPLPMHPCGRFNKNTLQSFIRSSYPNETMRILHRLDANTTGVLLMARNRRAAAKIQQQFAQKQIQKTYLARVQGHPQWDQITCQQPIGKSPSGPEGIRVVETETGSGNCQPATTEFEVLHRNPDGTCLIQCRPITGRTNQIRVHLAHNGFPIMGDVGYGKLDATKSHEAAIEAWEKDERQNGNQTNQLPQDYNELKLHAWKIGFRHPDGQLMTIEAPPPVWALL